jgi:hypothetical protein
MFNFLRKIFGGNKKQADIPSNNANEQTFDDFFNANKGKLINFNDLSDEQKENLQSKIEDFMSNQNEDTTITTKDLLFKLKQINDLPNVTHDKISSDNTSTFERVALDAGVFLTRDMGAGFQILLPNHITHLQTENINLFNVAMDNFWNKYGDKLEMVTTKWTDVYMLRCGDGLEANLFIYGNLVPFILEQLQIDTIEVFMPFSDTYFISSKFPDSTLKDIKETFLEKYTNEQSARVSAYVYKHQTLPTGLGKWTPIAKVF